MHRMRKLGVPLHPIVKRLAGDTHESCRCFERIPIFHNRKHFIAALGGMGARAPASISERKLITFWCGHAAPYLVLYSRISPNSSCKLIIVESRRSVTTSIAAGQPRRSGVSWSL